MAHVNDIDTLAELTRFHARHRPNKVAFQYEDRTTTYAEFDQLTNRVANGLLAEGLRAGSRVGFLDKNSDLFYQLVFGSAKAGAVSVGINWRLAPPEVAYILNDSRAEVLCVGPDFYGLVEQIKDQLTHVKRIIAMAPGHREWPDFSQWRDAQSADDPALPGRTGRRRDPDVHERYHGASERRAAAAPLLLRPAAAAAERRHGMERVDRTRRQPGRDAELPHRRRRLGGRGDALRRDEHRRLANSIRARRSR